MNVPGAALGLAAHADSYGAAWRRGAVASSYAAWYGTESHLYLPSGCPPLCSGWDKNPLLSNGFFFSYHFTSSHGLSLERLLIFQTIGNQVFTQTQPP